MSCAVRNGNQRRCCSVYRSPWRAPKFLHQNAKCRECLGRAFGSSLKWPWTWPAAKTFPSSPLNSAQRESLPSCCQKFWAPPTICRVRFVAYTKAIKARALGVSVHLLNSGGAVWSRRRWLKARSREPPADLAMAITGVAGTEPDEDGNPVGLVCIAVARKGGKPITTKNHYG
jgi:Competence-damaged protein